MEKSEAPLLLCLDSLGMLSTAKEVEDITGGANKVDMTKARIVKGAFRVLTLKLAKAGIPLLVTNHTYKQVGSYVSSRYYGWWFWFTVCSIQYRVPLQEKRKRWY